MNSSRNREFFFIAIVVLAVCVGAWLMFVEPKVKELAQLQTDIAQAGSQSSQLSENAIEQFARQVAGTRQLAQDIVAKNHTADDSSQLYTIIMDLAQKSSVQVQSLNPGSVPNASDDGTVIVTPIEVSVVGEYSHVALFVDSITSVQGFIRPNTLTIAPITLDQQQLVGARFTCQALHFNLPDALVKAGGSPDAPQSNR